MESKTEKTLIHPIDARAYKEKTYNDFVSREEFINRTGIFVSPDYFEYIYDIEFRDSGVSAEEFIQDYEEKYATCIQEIPLQGSFKYEVMDEDVNCVGEYNECHDPNIWEIVNSLARNSKAEFEKRYNLIEKIDKFEESTKGMLLLMKIIKSLNLCNDILNGLLGYLANNKACAEEIVGNEFLKDIWDISLNQIRMIHEDIGEKCRLFKQDNKQKERTKPMRQNIINCLDKLFSGTIDVIKTTYYTPKSHDVIKFTMFGHGIREENGLITVYDDREHNDQIIPKTVNIDPLDVDDVTYQDNQNDNLGIYERNVVIQMTDGSRIEMCTMGMG